MAFRNERRVIAGVTFKLDRQMGVRSREIREDAIARMERNTPGAGRTYKRQNPARVVQASAPGKAPIIDTGTLARSIEVKRRAPFAWAVVATAPYADDLEFGTRKMKARPFMRPAVRNVQQRRRRFRARTR